MVSYERTSTLLKCEHEQRLKAQSGLSRRDSIFHLTTDGKSKSYYPRTILGMS